MSKRSKIIVLASASPRRRELLTLAGVTFEVRVPSIDETPLRGETPRALVARLAREKAAAVGVDAVKSGVARDIVVLSADTTVAIGNRSFGKPRDDRDAAKMLRALSGVWHEVHTGFCVRRRKTARVKVVTTRVRFRKLSAADIARYIASGEHRDKAGAYAIQGEGAALIAQVRGSFTNVIGLPVAEVLAALR